MGEPLVALEQGAIKAPCSGHHKEVLPIKSEEPIHP